MLRHIVVHAFYQYGLKNWSDLRGKMDVSRYQKDSVQEHTTDTN